MTSTPPPAPPPPQRPRTFQDPKLSVFQAAAAEASRPERAGLADAPSSGAGAMPAAPVAARPELERAATRVAELQDAGRPVPERAEDGVSQGAWTCARLGLALVHARLRGDAAEAARLSEALALSRCDPRWASTLSAYLSFVGPDGARRPVPYVRPAKAGPGVIPIRADARVAILSDWATGRPAAMAALRDLAARDPDVLLHLGDIYYAGTAEECEANFRRPVEATLRARRRPGRRPRVAVYPLSGNHDMYAGGEAWYAMLRGLNRGALRQRASFFCLRSAEARWQFLAMDTGLHSDDPFGRQPPTRVEAEEEEWLEARVAEFGGGATVLLSHHQPFSALERAGAPGPDPWNAHLRRTFERLDGAARGAGGRVAAWFWGHEHTMALYAPHGGLERGRCVGCGAIPVFVGEEDDGRRGFRAPRPELRDPPAILPPRLGDDGVVYDRGYATVSLDPAAGGARAEYFGVRADGSGYLVHAEAL